MPPRGTFTGFSSESMWTSWGSRGPSARSYIWVRAIPRINESGRWTDWEQPCWEGLGDTGGHKNGHEPVMCDWSPESQPYPGLNQKKCGQQTDGGHFDSLLWWEPAWSTASSSGALSIAKRWTCWRGSRGGPRKLSEGWNTSPMRKGWESWGYSAFRRQDFGDTTYEPSSTWRGPTRKLERDFLQGHVVIEQGVVALNWKRVYLD